MSANAQTLDLPRGPISRLASPDGSKILYSVPNEKGQTEGPQLWIEDTRTHERTKLFDVSGTLSAGWSSDSSAFYVNDHQASDTEFAYIYDAASLKRVDIANRILSQDPGSRRLATGHQYFHATAWSGPKEVAVAFTGHTDEPPVLCFGLRYRITRTGAVTKLSQRVTPATATTCDESP